jgi:hypothetical protein
VGVAHGERPLVLQRPVPEAPWIAEASADGGRRIPIYGKGAAIPWIAAPACIMQSVSRHHGVDQKLAPIENTTAPSAPSGSLAALMSVFT